MKTGIFIISELTGPVAERIRSIQVDVDPRLAASGPPHITLAGSSGIGGIHPGTSQEQIEQAIGPIAADTAPLTLHFARPMRFMQTKIVVLPLDPHGPLRTLHERIGRSGLEFERARFAFTPHCTLSFYPTLTPVVARRLLAESVDEPVRIEWLQFYRTEDPLPPRKLLEMRLGGALPSSIGSSARTS
ncbi:MAG: 2'-5' RNA ligase family protein [Gemmatimonadaceae bacterium]